MAHNAKLLKKLRNNFFALSSFTFLIVIVGAFAAVYINTYTNVQQEIATRLEVARSDAHIFLSTNTEDGGGFNALSDPLIVRINLSETQEILSVYSLLDIPEDILEQLVDPFRGETSQAIIHSAHDNDIIAVRFESPQPTGIDMQESISVGGRDWRVVSFATLVNEYFGVAQMERSIIFLDVTDFNNTLSSLLYTLLIISLILVPIVAVINHYFANRAVRPIADAWEKQKQFIADASHELKTPITIIKSNLGIVISNPNEIVAEQMEWLDYANTGADRMSKLANDLLSLANADSPDLQIHKDNFDVSTVITDLIQEMRAKANEKSTEIFASLQPKIILLSDKEKILQIATILFDNAIKYSEPNGSIEISLAQMNQSVRLDVTNSGKGIKKAELHKIFDRFYQTEPSRNSKKEGFGLGLSIAKALTEKLGGRLSFVSEENGNTTFTFAVQIPPRRHSPRKSTDADF